MDYIHHCQFCGWQRPADSLTIASPRCEQCGCFVRASTAGSAELAETAPPDPGLPALSPRARLAIRMARTVGALGTIATAAILGYGLGGVPLAVAAAGGAGMLLVPLVFPSPWWSSPGRRGSGAELR